MNGIINILKPTGMTSSDCVMKIRGVLKTRKVGHLGTLDPLACGVLPIAVGKSTKMFDLFLKKEKTYRAFFDFSKTTDTLDSDGVVLSMSQRQITREELENAIKSQIGKIKQLPPLYSAKSINGERAYDLARRGESFELKSCDIEIFSIDIVRQYSDVGYILDIKCSSGTYIRSIVRDLAESMGVCGYMTALIRTEAGIFRLENAITVDELELLKDKAITKAEDAVGFLKDIVIQDEEMFFKISNGVKQSFEQEDGDYRLYYQKYFIGVLNITDGLGKIYLNLT